MFINLPSLKDPINSVLVETLLAKDFKDVEIQTLKKANVKLLLLLDGYDEIKDTRNIFNLSHLIDWENC